MISLNLMINQDFTKTKVEYELDDETLKIKLPEYSFLIESSLDRLEKPNNLNIELL